MKRSTILCTGVVLAVSSTIAVFTQQAESTSRTSSEVPRKNPMSLFAIDPVTWWVVGPEDEVETLDRLNTEEQVRARYHAALALHAPDTYHRLFPKSEEQLERERQAIDAIMNPLTREQVRARQTSEQNAADDRAMAEFYNIQGPPDKPARIYGPHETPPDEYFRELEQRSKSVERAE